MPAREQSLRLTDAYRAQLAALRVRTMVAAGQQWSAVTMDDLPGSFGRWLAAAAALLAAGQGAGITLTGAYLAAYLRAELATDAATPPHVPAGRVGQSVDGRPVTEALAPALITVRAALGQGRGRDEALRMGLARAARTVARETLGAPRLALSDAIQADDRILGWRRAVSGDACGACLGAATDAIRRDDDVPEVHDHCRCVAEPVVAGTRSDRFARPTGHDIFAGRTPAQQDALLGPDKAELIRTGEASLGDLVQREHWALGPVQITERPLGQLAT